MALTNTSRNHSCLTCTHGILLTNSIGAEESGGPSKIDSSNEKLGYKIREAQMKKTPYMLVLGDQEMANGTVNVRKYGDHQSEGISINDFKEEIVRKISGRCL